MEFRLYMINAIDEEKIPALLHMLMTNTLPLVKSKTEREETPDCLWKYIKIKAHDDSILRIHIKMSKYRYSMLSRKQLYFWCNFIHMRIFSIDVSANTITKLISLVFVFWHISYSNFIKDVCDMPLHSLIIALNVFQESGYIYNGACPLANNSKNQLWTTLDALDFFTDL